MVIPQMVSRRALIITNPGETGAENYCYGVHRDLAFYKAFLLSPLGGGWRADEIQELPRPSAFEAKSALNSISGVEYSLVIFAGHGYYTEDTTIVQLRAREELDSLHLRQGGSKRTVILDCCREVYVPMALDESRMDALAKADTSRSLSDARYYYDKEISRCSPGVIVMYGCSIGERAGDDPQRGGFFSSSLMRAAEDWSRGKTDTHENYYRLSVVGATEYATPRVRKLSAGKQTPVVEKPRSDPYFPFAIVA